MRPAIGGGKAVISSNVKVAAAGTSLDVPLGHKDDYWSFPHFDTITVSVADAPRPDEIIVVIAIAALQPMWHGADPLIAAKFTGARRYKTALRAANCTLRSPPATCQRASFPPASRSRRLSLAA